MLEQMGCGQHTPQWEETGKPAVQVQAQRGIGFPDQLQGTHGVEQRGQWSLGSWRCSCGTIQWLDFRGHQAETQNQKR